MFKRTVKKLLRLFSKKKRVLLLEDDTSMLRLITRILESRRYHVDSVWNGLEGIERLRKNSYDAILLDLMMPHEGGMTVLGHLEKEAPAKLQKVILVTAASAGIVDTWSRHVFGVVRKPFQPEELLATVTSCTEPKGS